MTNNYPTLLIHGLGGWGETDALSKVMPYWGFRPDRKLTNHLRKAGYEIYFPGLGMINSAWDRSCELWAYLMGGTVDYGKVHSEKKGHARYGRTYEHGVLEDWGKPGNHEKINLVGHSFGGPTVKQFAEIVLHGVQEEIDGTDPDDLSDFFKKDKIQKIHAVMTLSGVNNGTLFASMFGKKGMAVMEKALLKFMYYVGDTPVVKAIDFHMPQWGVTNHTYDIKGWNFRNSDPAIKIGERFCQNNEDSIAKEMQFETVIDEVNPKQTTDPKVYYFAKIACMTHPRKDNKHRPDFGMFLIPKLAGFFCGTWSNDNLVKKYGLDDSWWANDGFVNVVGQRAPFNAPQTEWNPIYQEVKPGIWYNMPIEYLHHMSWMGVGMDKRAFFKYYDNLLDFFKELPVIE